ncbi:MAG: hypothetical protein Tsb0020_51990 [Haliangiales bacterium]
MTQSAFQAAQAVTLVPQMTQSGFRGSQAAARSLSRSLALRPPLARGLVERLALTRLALTRRRLR